MGIMGFLGIAATSGYHALVRGMTERGVCAAASAALRAAKGRAQVDRRPVAVFTYNKLLREPSKDGMENGVAVGVLVAVRRIGRFSGVRDGFLYDEFGDLELCFESLEDEDELKNSKGVRLYKFNDGVSKMEYSTVADATYYDKKAIGVDLPSLPDVQGAKVYSGAYYDLGRSDNAPAWKTGDGYGVAFVEIQLKEGYVFGSSIPQSLGSIARDQAFEFRPDASDREIKIYSTKPNGSGMPTAWKDIGSAKSDDSGV